MSLMYRPRQADGALDQGDVLRSVPRPLLKLMDLDEIGEGATETTVSRKRVDGPARDGARAVVAYERVDALVLTQNCDMRGPTILLAPIDGVGSLSPKPDKRAQQTVGFATNLERGFYLPDLPPLGLARRTALLAQVFSVPADDLQRFVTAEKSIVVGLQDRALEYLQFRLGVVFGRKAREDYDWPSVEDIEDQIARITNRLDSTKDPEERALIEAELRSAQEWLPRIRDHVEQKFPSESVATSR